MLLLHKGPYISASTTHIFKKNPEIFHMSNNHISAYRLVFFNSSICTFSMLAYSRGMTFQVDRHICTFGISAYSQGMTFQVDWHIDNTYFIVDYVDISANRHITHIMYMKLYTPISCLRLYVYHTKSNALKCSNKFSR